MVGLDLEDGLLQLSQQPLQIASQCDEVGVVSLAKSLTSLEVKGFGEVTEAKQLQD